MANLEQMQSRIERLIPISRALGIRLARFDGNTLVVAAPLAPNHNHQDTGFGGSLYSVAIVACWTLLQLWLDQKGLVGNIVIQTGTIDYSDPVTGDFEAQASLPEGPAMERFESMFRRHGKARLSLTGDLLQEGQPRGRFVGRFAMLGEH